MRVGSSGAAVQVARDRVSGGEGIKELNPNKRGEGGGVEEIGLVTRGKSEITEIMGGAIIEIGLPRGEGLEGPPARAKAKQLRGRRKISPRRASVFKAGYSCSFAWGDLLQLVQY